MVRDVCHELGAKLHELKIYRTREFVTVVTAALLKVAAFCFLVLRTVGTLIRQACELMR
jgi:hypothetical protein